MMRGWTGGALPHDEAKRGDSQVTRWAISTLATPAADPRPFFLGVGYFAPHVPCYVTPERLARIPDDDTVLPAVRADDRADVPPFARYLNWRLPEPRLDWLQAQGQWRHFVRCYLASIETVDEQIGQLLEALDAAGLTNRTIIVLWGDNGFSPR